MNQEKSVGLGLFILSVAILTLEVLQMRILALQMWYHHAYMVVSLTLLGFAAAGTVVTVWPKLAAGDVNRKLAWSSILFGVTLVGAYLIMLRMGDRLTSLSSEGTFGVMALFYSIMVFPYFFAGLVITIALSSTERVHVRYFVNLIGSALGAWVFIVAISPLGGERLLVVCAALGPVAAMGFLASSPRSRTFAAALVALLCSVPFLLQADTWLKVEIGSGKLHFKGEHIDRRWTPLTCIDLLKNKDKPAQIFILQDGGAGTFMHDHTKWTKRSVFSPEILPYIPHMRRMKEGGEGPSVAVIGIGGGLDLRNAADYGASRVKGIEINDEMMRVTGEDYADFNGHLYDLPGVSVELGEGRSTLRRLDEKFDIILTAGADTYTAATTASFVLSESYLYTKEAIRDFLDHLAPGGTLGMTRFADVPPHEMLRLMAMGLDELRRRGIEEPSRHVVIIKSLFVGGTVFSLDPLLPADIKSYLYANRDKTGAFEVLYVPGMEAESEFTRLAAAYDEGTEKAYFENYPVDIRPVTDDSPFYYNFHHLLGSWEQERSLFAERFNYNFPVAPALLFKLLVQATALVLILVLLPLFILKRGGLKAKNAGRHFIYFLALGVAFMFLEISTIQRLALFLGHPTYSITVVLFSFLFFAGLGSYFSGRLSSRAALSMRWVLLILTGVILLFTLVLTPLLDMVLHLPLGVRIAAAIAILAPMNFLMGMPFPLGLGRLKKRSPELVPWALAANGGASVIGSILCVMLAMEIGFMYVAVLSAAVYFIAMLAATTGSLGASTSE